MIDDLSDPSIPRNYWFDVKCPLYSYKNSVDSDSQMGLYSRDCSIIIVGYLHEIDVRVTFFIGLSLSCKLPE